MRGEEEKKVTTQCPVCGFSHSRRAIACPKCGEPNDNAKDSESPEEIEEARKRDPVKVLADQLQQIGVLSEDLGQEIHQEARQIVDEATDDVDSAPYPGTEEFFKHVYAP